MHEKLDIQDKSITNFLLEQYSLQAVEITFLPKGGDINAAAYRVITKDESRYFLKLLRGVFDETSISDIHAGNLLIDANGSLYIVDWDHPILAPKERDLMFVGGGIGSIWYRPQEEVLFYEGYGRTEINNIALAYYRFERIVQDIAEWGEQLLLTGEGGKDRARALQGFVRWFSPNDVVEMAYKTENTLPPELKSQTSRM
jgi:hypothetical protein